MAIKYQKITNVVLLYLQSYQILFLKIKNIIGKYFQKKYAVEKKKIMNAINEELNLGKSDDDQFDIDKSNKSE